MLAQVLIKTWERVADTGYHQFEEDRIYCFTREGKSLKDIETWILENSPCWWCVGYSILEVVDGHYGECVFDNNPDYYINECGLEADDEFYSIQKYKLEMIDELDEY